MEELAPKIVIVDFFRTLEPDGAVNGDLGLREFVQRLAAKLTSWQATTFLLGEDGGGEGSREHPVFTMADGLFIMAQRVSRNSMVRRCRRSKSRQRPTTGPSYDRIQTTGFGPFPRMLKPVEEAQGEVSRELISTGVAGLDEMMGGGDVRGNAILIAGPVGSGKTTVAVQFLDEGASRGEPGVLIIFEETAPKYLDQAHTLGFDLEAYAKAGLLEIVYFRPLHLSVDETLYAIQSAVDKVGAKRVVLDSISGLEAALAPAFKEDFSESLYRLLGALTGSGVTVLLTVEVIEPYNEMRFSPHAISFLTHDIVLQRYYEVAGELRKFMAVVKTRARAHSPRAPRV